MDPLSPADFLARQDSDGAGGMPKEQEQEISAFALCDVDELDQVYPAEDSEKV